MSKRQEDNWKTQAWEEATDFMQEAIQEAKPVNNIPFVWTSEPASITSREETVITFKQACQLADRQDLLDQFEQADEEFQYYVAKAPQGVDKTTGQLNDSTAADDLVTGNTYYLCQI